MNGRVLSEEEINEKEQELVAWFSGTSDTSHHRAVVIAMNALATIRDRDKTIAELHELRKMDFEAVEYRESVYKQQNAIMLEAIHQVCQNCEDCGGDGWADVHRRCEACLPLYEAIAKAKAVTVSKQEESTVSEVACEQPNKDSLNVARQNKPTHPTQQINRLAQEVASDMRWREGEPM